MTTISHQLNRIVKLRYLEQLNRLDLAHWLIDNFSPDRYLNEKDCVKEAIRLLYDKSNDHQLATEFVCRLFGMFGQSDMCGKEIP